MSKRLQVLLEEDELDEVRAAARSEGVTVAEWVRASLRASRRRTSGADMGAKLAAVRSATRHAFPTGEVDEMLGEIERGRIGDESA